MRFALAATLLGAVVLGACAPEAPSPQPQAPPDSEAARAVEPQIDPVSGLKMAENWELVRAACTACHSAKQITQQRGTAEQWLTMIRWMQKKQNLWAFDPATEEKIVAYLAANYPPSAAQRRAALPPDLMPLNPYTQ